MLPNRSRLPGFSGRVTRAVVGVLTSIGLVASVNAMSSSPSTGERTVATTMPLLEETIAAPEPVAASGDLTSTMVVSTTTNHEDHAAADVPSSVSENPTTLAPATTAPTITTVLTTTAPVATTATTAAGPLRMVIAEDTMIMGETLVLRPGDTIEFHNGARLMFHTGASADWQGTPTSTWSNDGQVQNLERDIEIFGSGDIMFMEGSLPSVIRFVEIDLQPKRELGHYPLHWHFAGNGSRGTLVEGVVVKNSTNRAFVPHASHGITFRDTIAKNISGEGYWWDLPPSRVDESNNSNEIVYDHVLADGVTNKIGDERGFRLTAFSLGAGQGNIVRNSVALNVNPSHIRNCSGFGWPEGGQSGLWVFRENKTFGSACHGIFVWQNTDQATVIDGFTSTEGIEHGAYTNVYEYRHIDVPYIVAHAVGWSVTSGHIDVVRVFKHQSSGAISFSDAVVGSLEIMNKEDDGNRPGAYIFDRTGLACENVAWVSWVPGTTVTIDGSLCTPP